MRSSALKLSDHQMSEVLDFPTSARFEPISQTPGPGSIAPARPWTLILDHVPRATRRSAVAAKKVFIAPLRGDHPSWRVPGCEKGAPFRAPRIQVCREVRPNCACAAYGLRRQARRTPR